MKCSVVSFGVSMGLAWLWAARLVMFRVVFLFDGELVWCICTGTCWLLGGAWFQHRYGDFWVSSCLLMFLESGVL